MENCFLGHVTYQPWVQGQPFILSSTSSYLSTRSWTPPFLPFCKCTPSCVSVQVTHQCHCLARCHHNALTLIHHAPHCTQSRHCLMLRLCHLPRRHWIGKSACLLTAFWCVIHLPCTKKQGKAGAAGGQHLIGAYVPWLKSLFEKTRWTSLPGEAQLAIWMKVFER